MATWVGANTYAVVVIARGGKDATTGRDPASVGLAFSDVVYGRGADGAALSGWFVEGDADRPVVVVVHGYGGNRIGTLEVGPPLHALGYGLLYAELGYVRGGGRYRGGDREADEVGRAVAWVGKNTGRPAVLLGFSGGAFASLAATARGAKVIAVVADSGFVSFRHVAAFRAGLPRFLGVLMPVLYPLASGGGHLVDLAREIKGGSLAVPALIIHGTADETVPPGGGADLAELTGGDLWELPGVGHTKAFDADRPTYIARIDRFIRDAQAR